MLGIQDNKIGYYILLVGGVILMLMMPHYFSGNAILILLITSVVFNCLAIYALYNRSLYRRLFSMVTGLVYLALPLALLNTYVLKSDIHPLGLLIGLIVLIWTSDTGAYLVGSRVGKSKLFPSVSPNKTWEGAVGAAFSALIMSLVISRIFDEFSVLFWLGSGIIVWLIGMYGDLVESSLKRRHAIKDTGNFLPGHGGFLDRFDSFIFVIPFVLLWMNICSLILH